MSLAKPWECEIGDITSAEVCIARSAEARGVWVTMWRNENDNFEVSRMNPNADLTPDKAVKILGFQPDLQKARARYSEECQRLGVDPHP